MSTNVHGTAGWSLREDGARMYGAAAARRGGFIEEATARALEHWLSRRPDSAGLHLFHDLGGFRDVAGHGLPPVSLGTANIDHVILSGARWLLVDAKGTAAGTLTTDSVGKGVLIQADGSKRPEPWLDNTRTRSAAGVLVRLTGLRGWPVWVVPTARSTTRRFSRRGPSGPAEPSAPSATCTTGRWIRYWPSRGPGSRRGSRAVCGQRRRPGAYSEG